MDFDRMERWAKSEMSAIESARMANRPPAGRKCISVWTWSLVIVGVLGLSLRLWVAATVPLDDDEMNMAIAVRRAQSMFELREISGTSALVSYLPNYGLVQLFGFLTPLTARLFNLAFGVLAVVFMGFLARDAAGYSAILSRKRSSPAEKVDLESERDSQPSLSLEAAGLFGVLCAFLLAILPEHIRHSAYSRYYGYYSFFWMLLAWSGLRLVNAPTFIGFTAWLMLGAVSLILGYYSHLFTALLAPGAALFLSIAATIASIRGWSSNGWRNTTLQRIERIGQSIAARTTILCVGWIIVATAGNLLWTRVVSYDKKADYVAHGISNGFDFVLYWTNALFPFSIHWSWPVFILICVGALMLVLQGRLSAVMLTIGYASTLLLVWRLLWILRPAKTVEPRYMLPLLSFSLPLLAAGPFVAISRAKFLIRRLRQPRRFSTLLIGGSAGLMILASWWVYPILSVWPRRDEMKLVDFVIDNSLENSSLYVYDEMHGRGFRHLYAQRTIGTASGLVPGEEPSRTSFRRPDLGLIDTPEAAQDLVQRLRTGEQEGAVILAPRYAPWRISKVLADVIKPHFTAVPYREMWAFVFPNFLDIPLACLISETDDPDESGHVRARQSVYIPAPGLFQPTIAASHYHLTDGPRIRAYRQWDGGESAKAWKLAEEMKIGIESSELRSGIVDGETKNYFLSPTKAILYPAVWLEQGFHTITVEAPLSSIEANASEDRLSLALLLTGDSILTESPFPERSLFLQWGLPDSIVIPEGWNPRFVRPLPHAEAAPEGELYTSIRRLQTDIPIRYWLAQGEWEFTLSLRAARYPGAFFGILLNENYIARPRVDYDPRKWQSVSGTFRVNQTGIYELSLRNFHQDAHRSDYAKSLLYDENEYFQTLTLRRR